MNLRLENWSVVSREDGYKAPELHKPRLCGDVCGHPWHKDGTYIVTSRVLFIDTVNKMAKTNNNVYVLGEPNKEWIDWLKKNNYKIEQFNFGEKK